MAQFTESCLELESDVYRQMSESRRTVFILDTQCLLHEWCVIPHQQRDTLK